RQDPARRSGSFGRRPGRGVSERPCCSTTRVAMSSIRHSVVVGLAALGLLAAAGCEDKKAPKPAEGADSGAPRAGSRADKNIVDALRAEGSAQAQQGPPETGLFAPGAADAQMKIGDPPKVVVGAKGATPGVQLVSQPAGKGKKLEGKIEV